MTRITILMLALLALGSCAPAAAAGPANQAAYFGPMTEWRCLSLGTTPVKIPVRFAGGVRGEAYVCAKMGEMTPILERE